jgi:hypothetical protein
VQGMVGVVKSFHVRGICVALPRGASGFWLTQEIEFFSIRVFIKKSIYIIFFVAIFILIYQSCNLFLLIFVELFRRLVARVDSGSKRLGPGGQFLPRRFTTMKKCNFSPQRATASCGALDPPSSGKPIDVAATAASIPANFSRQLAHVF